MVLRKSVLNSFNSNRYFCFKTITTSVAFKEKLIQISGVNVNYMKIGSGPHTVLCVPGGIGTMETDFRLQLEGFHLRKFSMVAYDPPGYGKSRPPERDFSGHFYERGAEFLAEFMKKLNISRYSILGWSAGSAISMIHAAKFPQAIDKLVVFGAHSYITSRELNRWKQLNDLHEWSEQYSKVFLDIYGEENLRYLWKKLTEGITRFYQLYDGDVCKDLLKDIQCPTYILYGEKDTIIGPDQVSYLKSHIRHSRVHLYPEGKHNIHQRYAEDFNKRVQDFLLEDSEKFK